MNLVCTSDGSGLKPLRPLCLDVRNAAKRRGWSTILYELNGAENQKWTLEEDGRMIPHHAGHLCLDIKYGRISAEAKLHTWTHLQPIAANQAFSVIDNYLTVGGGFGGLVVGLDATSSLAPTTIPGARLVLVSRDSPRSLRWEWAQPPPSAPPRPPPSQQQTDLPHPPRETRAAECSGNSGTDDSDIKGEPSVLRAVRTATTYYAALGLSADAVVAGLDDSAVRRACEWRHFFLTKAY